MKFLIAATLSLASSAAFAGEVTLSAPGAGATLKQGPVDLSVYWTETDMGRELVATYVTDRAPADPAQMVMLLNEGDTVTFGLPGVRGHAFRFASQGDAVTVEGLRTRLEVASN